MASLEHDEIVSAARRCFAAGTLEEAADATAGPLLDYLRLYEGLPGFLRPFLWRNQVRSLRVEEVDRGAAYCDCDVVLVDDYARRSGWRGRSVARITAPLVLVRTQAGWRVADYCLNGRRLLRSTRLYDAAAQVHTGQLALRPRSLELARLGTILICDVTNSTAAEVRLEQATTLGKGRIGPWLRERNFAAIAGSTRFQPGETGRAAILWAMPWPLTAKAMKVQLRFAGVESGAPTWADLELPFATQPEPMLTSYE